MDGSVGNRNRNLWGNLISPEEKSNNSPTIPITVDLFGLLNVAGGNGTLTPVRIRNSQA